MNLGIATTERPYIKEGSVTQKVNYDRDQVNNKPLSASVELVDNETQGTFARIKVMLLGNK